MTIILSFNKSIQVQAFTPLHHPKDFVYIRLYHTLAISRLCYVRLESLHELAYMRISSLVEHVAWGYLDFTLVEFVLSLGDLFLLHSHIFYEVFMIGNTFLRLSIMPLLKTMRSSIHPRLRGMPHQILNWFICRYRWLNIDVNISFFRRNVARRFLLISLVHILWTYKTKSNLWYRLIPYCMTYSCLL